MPPVTRVMVSRPLQIQVSHHFFGHIRPDFNSMGSPRGYEPEIGDVHEGIVERSEDASNAEDELTCEDR